MQTDSSELNGKWKYHFLWQAYFLLQNLNLVQERHVDAWSLAVLCLNAIPTQQLLSADGSPLPFFHIDNFVYGVEYTTGLA